MDELGEKKLENTRSIQFLREYLGKMNLSNQITSHPRFESILWKLSSIMRRLGVRAFSQEAVQVLSSTVIVQTDGSITIFENEERTANLASSKYYFDSEENVLRRICCQPSTDGSEITRVSTYNEEGLEVDLLTEQKCLDGSKYYSHATRVPERIDMIHIESIDERKGKRTRLEDAYQIRTFCVAYEDIEPSADEIDPLDIVMMSFLGVPPIYRDLEEKELKAIEECDGEIFPLDDIHKVEQFNDYVQRNLFYGRTRRFEGAVASYLEIENQLQNEEQL